MCTTAGAKTLKPIDKSRNNNADSKPRRISLKKKTPYIHPTTQTRDQCNCQPELKLQLARPIPYHDPSLNIVEPLT